MTKHLPMTMSTSPCYNCVHRCTLDFTGWQESKLRTQNTPSVPVLTISEPSAHRSQAPVLSTDPKSNAITTLGVDLTGPPKVLKITLCRLDTPHLLVAQQSCIYLGPQTPFDFSKTERRLRRAAPTGTTSHYTRVIRNHCVCTLCAFATLAA